MAKNGANIDFVFRNGLKDFEVIPPSDVWDNIHPNIKTKQRSVVLISAAASITVLLTLSFFAYQWSSKISSEQGKSVIALNVEPSSPVTSGTITSPVSASNLRKPVSRNSGIPVENTSVNISKLVKDNITTPEIFSSQEVNRLPMNFTRPQNGPTLASSNKPPKDVFRISDPGLQFPLVNTPKKVVERWSIAAMASPTYYSHINSGGNDVTKQLISSEQPLISYSGGVAFSYKINKRLSVQSGLYYSSLGQVVDGISSYAGFQKYDYTKGDHNFSVPTSNGIITTSNADVFLVSPGSGNRILTAYTSDVFDPKKNNLQYINSTIRQNFSYLELPVMVRYKIVDKIIDFNLIGGLSYNLLVNNDVFTMVEGNKYSIGETEKLNPLSISSTIGMGMEYNLSSRVSLNLEPTLRYYLNPINGTTGTTVHPYSFGIFSGVSYKF